MCFGYIVISVLFVSVPANCYVLTENQIKEDIKYLSQTSDGIKPSRLRALLLADLKRALPTVIYFIFFCWFLVRVVLMQNANQSWVVGIVSEQHLISYVIFLQICVTLNGITA